MKRSAVWLSLALLASTAQAWADPRNARTAAATVSSIGSTSAVTAPRIGSTRAVTASTAGWTVPRVARRCAAATWPPNGSTREAIGSTAASTAAVPMSIGAWIDAALVRQLIGCGRRRLGRPAPPDSRHAAYSSAACSSALSM